MPPPNLLRSLKHAAEQIAKAGSKIGKVGVQLIVGNFVAGLDPNFQKLIQGLKYRNFYFDEKERIDFYDYLKKSDPLIRSLKEKSGIAVTIKRIDGYKEFIIVKFYFMVNFKNPKYSEVAKKSFEQFKNTYIPISLHRLVNATDPTGKKTIPYYFIIQKNISEKINTTYALQRDFGISKLGKYEFSRYEFDLSWCITDKFNITSFNNSLTKKKSFNELRKFKQYKAIIPRDLLENTSKTNPPDGSLQMFKDFVIPQLFNEILQFKKSSSEPPLPSILSMSDSETDTFIQELLSEIIKNLQRMPVQQITGFGAFQNSYNPSLGNNKTVTSSSLKLIFSKSDKMFDIRLSHKDHPNINQFSAIVNFNLKKKKAFFLVCNKLNKFDSENFVNISSISIFENPESIAKFMITNAPRFTSYTTHLQTLKTFI